MIGTEPPPGFLQLRREGRLLEVGVDGRIREELVPERVELRVDVLFEPHVVGPAHLGHVLDDAPGDAEKV